LLFYHLLGHSCFVWYYPRFEMPKKNRLKDKFEKRKKEQIRKAKSKKVGKTKSDPKLNQQQNLGIKLRRKNVSKKQRVREKTLTFLKKLKTDDEKRKPFHGQSLRNFEHFKTAIKSIKEMKAGPKRNPRINQKRIRQLLDTEVKLFLEVLNHPEYMNNPRAALRQHVLSELRMQGKTIPWQEEEEEINGTIKMDQSM